MSTVALIMRPLLLSMTGRSPRDQAPAADLLSRLRPAGARREQDVPQDADAAVRALFLAHHARLVGHARLLVDDLQTAEDLVQDAFLALHRRWDGLRDKGAALDYLRTAVTNGAASKVRHLQVVRRRDRATHLPDAPSAEQQALGREEHRQLRAGLAALPVRQRQVVVLRYYLDLSEAQIADQLQISKGAVKAHASRAVAALGLRLEATS